MNRTVRDVNRGSTPGSLKALAVVAWLWVLIPFGYGLYQLFTRIPALFSG